jgi:hypothetical protein
VRSAMADRKRSSDIGLSRAAILLRRAIVGCTMILLCALMVHPREHQDQDAPEGWGIWGAAKITAAAATAGAMGIALLQESQLPWGACAAPALAAAVGGAAGSLSPRHFCQLRVRAGAVGRLFAKIVATTGGAAWRFFARIAAAAATAGGAAWCFFARIAVAMGGAAGSLSPRHFC